MGKGDGVSEGAGVCPQGPRRHPQVKLGTGWSSCPWLGARPEWGWLWRG